MVYDFYIYIFMYSRQLRSIWNRYREGAIWTIGSLSLIDHTLIFIQSFYLLTADSCKNNTINFIISGIGM